MNLIRYPCDGGNNKEQESAIKTGRNMALADNTNK